MPTPNLPKQNSNVYLLTAIAGLLILALHAMGMGVQDPALVLTPHNFAIALPDVWPYLGLSLGLFAQRRWARDLAAPTACLALISALAVFPRYLFLVPAYSLYGAQTSHLPIHSILSLFHGELFQQASLVIVCAGTFYALTRPLLITRCQTDPKQPHWTHNLTFAALLPLSREFFIAGDALNLALYRIPNKADLFQANWPNLEPAILAVSALVALVGLWKRKVWGWLAALAQTLFLLFQNSQGAFSQASGSFYHFQDKAPAAAGWLAGEAACRSLPELVVLACVLIALLKSRRQFHL